MNFTKTCIFFKPYPRAGGTTDCQDHFQTVWTSHSDHGNCMYSGRSQCQDFLTLNIIPSYAEGVQHKHYNCIVEFQFFSSLQYQVSWITTGHSTGKHIAVGWGTHVSFYDSNSIHNVCLHRLLTPSVSCTTLTNTNTWQLSQHLATQPMKLTIVLPPTQPNTIPLPLVWCNMQYIKVCGNKAFAFGPVHDYMCGLIFTVCLTATLAPVANFSGTRHH